jgi:DNA repair protein RecO (recombination protein O)
MPLRETEAIVLRIYRLGEADKIASLFTRQVGRLRVVAKGAFRPKSKFGGALEPLSYLRAQIFERENRDLLPLNSVELIESFFGMQSDYEVQLAAQFLAEVGERLLPEHEANERTFRLFLTVLRALKISREVDRPLVYFDYWMLKLGGFLPNLAACANCGQSLDDDGGYSSRGHESLYCRDCKRPGSTRIDGAILAAVRAACQQPLEAWLEQGKAVAGIGDARKFFEDIIESHADKRLVTRQMMGGES